MKRIVLFSCVCLCIAAGMFAAARLPVDRSALVRKKYSSWAGVLRVWVADDCGPFTPIGWLNACAAATEKNYSGVYISIHCVPSEAISSYKTSGVNPPDVIIYPSSLSVDTDGLSALTSSHPMREGLKHDTYSLPLMLDAHFWIYRDALPGDLYEVPIACRTDDINSLAALCTGLRQPAAEGRSLPGIDLGLKGGTQAAPPDENGVRCRVSTESIITDEPRAAFVAGDVSAFVANIGDVLRMPESADWAATATGDYAYVTDALMCSMLASGDGRDDVSRTFINHLMNEGQSQTAMAGGFPAIAGVSAWAGDISIAPAEAALEGCVWLMGAYGESDAAHLYIEGNISADEAMARIRSGL